MKTSYWPFACHSGAQEQEITRRTCSALTPPLSLEEGAPILRVIRRAGKIREHARAQMPGPRHTQKHTEIEERMQDIEAATAAQFPLEKQAHLALREANRPVSEENVSVVAAAIRSAMAQRILWPKSACGPLVAPVKQPLVWSK